MKYLITKNRVVSNFGETQVEAKDTRRARLGAEATRVGAAQCYSGVFRPLSLHEKHTPRRYATSSFRSQ